MVICTLFLTGCWSQVEINDRAFVSTILVDKAKNGQIELTLTFPLPNRLVSSLTAGRSSPGNPYAALTYKGVNISEAFHKAQVDLPRRISFGQAKVLVIGDKMAKEGIVKILEFIIREPSLNLNISMYVAPKKAQDILPMVPDFENSQTRILLGFAKNEIALRVTPKDFLETNNGNMIVSRLKVEKRKMLSEKGKEAVRVGTDGMALFDQYKMVGKLSSYEGRGALWFREAIKNFLVTIKSPTDKKNISLIVRQTKTKIRPSKQDPFTFDVYVNVEDDVSESNSAVDLKKDKNLKQLQIIAQTDIKNRIEAAFQSTKRTGADAFQLGEYLSWYKPKIWKSVKSDWQTVYRDKVKLNIHIDLNIEHVGTEGNPFWTKELNP
ncbi:Ger(x)C family spore germination protein [Bacillus sp. ISL-75]|uniref:Ger(x)C family spore germination protein n=1 Tax=Bacillus sp. ISL-75 TaxID=2819137 RepID=UPI002035E1E9|nr:Ger(x)C family spore germination protein [Bacillus sp. ISL-75]